MTYRVELLNDHRDWILKGYFKTLAKAETVAETVAESGYDVRIISEGQIVKRIGKGE